MNSVLEVGVTKNRFRNPVLTPELVGKTRCRRKEIKLTIYDMDICGGAVTRIERAKPVKLNTFDKYLRQLGFSPVYKDGNGNGKHKGQQAARSSKGDDLGTTSVAKKEMRDVMSAVKEELEAITAKIDRLDQVREPLVEKRQHLEALIGLYR